MQRPKKPKTLSNTPPSNYKTEVSEVFIHPIFNKEVKLSNNRLITEKLLEAGYRTSYLPVNFSIIKKIAAEIGEDFEISCGGGDGYGLTVIQNIPAENYEEELVKYNNRFQIYEKELEEYNATLAEFNKLKTQEQIKALRNEANRLERESLTE